MSLLTTIAGSISLIPAISESPDGILWKGIINTIGFQSAFLATSLTALFFWRYPEPESLGFRHGSPLTLGMWILVTTPVAVLLCYTMNEVIHHFLLQQDMVPTTQQVAENIKNAESQLPLIFMFFTTVILAPLAEELFFRGVLFEVMKARGEWLAYLFISVIFGLLHFQSSGSEGAAGMVSGLMGTLPLMFLSGLMFCVYRVTGNILSAIFCHIGFNLYGFIMLRISESQIP